MSVTITWYGQAATTITYNENVLLIDPWFKGNPVSPIKPEDLKRVDTVAVTHGHFDHFGDCLEICKNFDAKLICTPEIAWYADGKGISRGSQALPLGFGGQLTVGEFTLAMVRAVHPSALYGDEWHTRKKYFPDGGAASYIITVENKVIYHAGDTALFSDMKLIADRYHPELGLLPIGGRFTMDIIDAAKAIQLLGLNAAIPIHYNTFPDLEAEPKELISELKSKSIDAEVIILNPGESHVLK
jgi:L-ascorbate metabolism protein UlaG (beta-lactamase superfamily)